MGFKSASIVTATTRGGSALTFGAMIGDGVLLQQRCDVGFHDIVTAPLTDTQKEALVAHFAAAMQEVSGVTIALHSGSD